MIKKNAIIVLLVVFGTFSFLLNYSIEKNFDRCNVFNQNDLMFHADAFMKLKCFSNGGKASPWKSWKVIHPNLMYFFHFPIRLTAKIIGYFADADEAFKSRIRRILALLVVPAFSALNTIAITLLFYRLNFTFFQVCSLTTLSIFSFTQIVFGSMPESFALNGFFITLCFLLSINLLKSKRLNWVIWTIIGAFGMGITITNIVILIIIFSISSYSISKDISSSIKKTLLLICLATTFTFSFSIGLGFLMGTKPSAADIKGPVYFTEQFIRKDFIKYGLKFPLAVVSSITPGSIKTREITWIKKPRGKYRHQIQIAYEDNNRIRFILVIIITIIITSIGAINLLKSDLIFKTLAIASLLTLTYNWLFHAFWGNEYFLYSQHWICALIILISGIFLTKRPFLLPITSVFSVFLIYIIYNNFVTLNDIFHFFRNYSV